MKSRSTTTEHAHDTLVPFQAIPPGETLLEEIEARGWTQADFAEITGRPTQAINEIITGKKAITPQTAIAFGNALGTSAEYWLNLESLYRLTLAKQDQSGDDLVARRSQLYSLAPVKELIKREWITVKNPRNVDELERAMCDFFEIPSPDVTPQFHADARRSSANEEMNVAHRAWFFRVKHVARKESAELYSKQKLEENITAIRDLCRTEKETSRVKKTLANVGIRFVIVEHLPHTKIDGGSIWLDEKKPVVALSLRYDRIDCFWHTLMHEISHILNEDSRVGEPIVDEELVGGTSQERRNQVETRADRQAADWLIPRALLNKFIEKNKPFYSTAAIAIFAVEVRAHPAIVVGQLQFLGEVPWTHFRSLLIKVKPFVVH